MLIRERTPSNFVLFIVPAACLHDFVTQSATKYCLYILYSLNINRYIVFTLCSLIKYGCLNNILITYHICLLSAQSHYFLLTIYTECFITII